MGERFANNNDHILVCLSYAPSNTTIIQTAPAMARALHASMGIPISSAVSAGCRKPKQNLHSVRCRSGKTCCDARHIPLPAAPPAKKILSTRWRCTATRWTGRRGTSILPSPHRTVINAVTTSSLPSSFCEKIWRFIFFSADVSRDLRSSISGLKTACIRNTVIQWANAAEKSARNHAV